jgi:hypothetical protein
LFWTRRCALTVNARPEKRLAVATRDPRPDD